MRSTRLIVTICGCLMGLLVLVAAGPPAATANAAKHRTVSWSAVRSPDPKPPFLTFRASCVSPKFCMAVGASVAISSSAIGTRGLAERWNGHTWSVVATPSDGDHVYLISVSCVSRTFCAAVGVSQGDAGVPDSPIAETWDGQHWTLRATPSLPSDVDLSDVACTGSHFCLAVGSADDPTQCPDGSHTDDGTDALAEMWNGSSWSMTTTPHFGSCGAAGGGANGHEDTLSGVSCASSFSCLAVGDYDNAFGVTPDGTRTAAASWNGVSWTAEPGLDPAANNKFNAVSCPAAGSCWAVGAAFALGTLSGNSLAEFWDGTAWSVATTPSVEAGDAALTGVSCTHPTLCVAVGAGVGSQSNSVVDKLDGGTWTRGHPPANISLQGVTCLSNTQCFAVGVAYDDESPNDQGISGVVVDVGGSADTTVPLADPASEDSQLSSVSCVGQTCFAVGSFTGLGQWPLFEIGHKRSWSRMTAADVVKAGSAALMVGLSCTTAKSCMAVGTQTDSDATSAIAQQWDGSTWSSVTTAPNVKPGALDAVSCTGPRVCMAVGWQNAATMGDIVTLAERWNGARWKAVPPAGPTSAAQQGLSGISCANPRSCVAVGYQLSQSGVEHVLAERWNGQRWSVLKARNQGREQDTLTAVSCPTTTTCVMVGYTDFNERTAALIERLHNGHWTVMKPPNDHSKRTFLNGVSCQSATHCEAVGTRGEAHQQTLIESFTNGKWAVTRSANHGANANSLAAISCDQTLCDAVGTFRNTHHSQTLVETAT